MRSGKGGKTAVRGGQIRRKEHRQSPYDTEWEGRDEAEDEEEREKNEQKEKKKEIKSQSSGSREIIRLLRKRRQRHQISIGAQKSLKNYGKKNNGRINE